MLCDVCNGTCHIPTESTADPPHAVLLRTVLAPPQAAPPTAAVDGPEAPT